MLVAVVDDEKFPSYLVKLSDVCPPGSGNFFGDEECCVPLVAHVVKTDRPAMKSVNSSMQVHRSSDLIDLNVVERGERKERKFGEIRLSVCCLWLKGLQYLTCPNRLINTLFKQIGNNLLPGGIFPIDLDGFDLDIVWNGKKFGGSDVVGVGSREAPNKLQCHGK